MLRHNLYVLIFSVLFIFECTTVDGVRADEAMTLRHFSIPSQPLDMALLTFSEATGIQVLYENAFTGGRYSAPVDGMMTPEAALSRLLQGTGLVSRFTVEHGFTVAPQEALRPNAPDAKASPGRGWEHFMPFFGSMQAGIVEKLCQRPDTYPHGERLALRLWIDATGTVEAVELKDPSPNRARNQAIVAVLRGLALEIPPPGDMPQPVTVNIGGSGRETCAKIERH